METLAAALLVLSTLAWGAAQQSADTEEKALEGVTDPERRAEILDDLKPLRDEADTRRIEWKAAHDAAELGKNSNSEITHYPTLRDALQKAGMVIVGSQWR